MSPSPIQGVDMIFHSYLLDFMLLVFVFFLITSAQTFSYRITCIVRFFCPYTIFSTKHLLQVFGISWNGYNRCCTGIQPWFESMEKFKDEAIRVRSAFSKLSYKVHWSIFRFYSFGNCCPVSWLQESWDWRFGRHSAHHFDVLTSIRRNCS